MTSVACTFNLVTLTKGHVIVNNMLIRYITAQYKQEFITSCNTLMMPLLTYSTVGPNCLACLTLTDGYHHFNLVLKVLSLRWIRDLRPRRGHVNRRVRRFGEEKRRISVRIAAHFKRVCPVHMCIDRTQSDDSRRANGGLNLRHNKSTKHELEWVGRREAYHSVTLSPKRPPNPKG